MAKGNSSRAHPNETDQSSSGRIREAFEEGPAAGTSQRGRSRPASSGKSGRMPRRDAQSRNQNSQAGDFILADLYDHYKIDREEYKLTYIDAWDMAKDARNDLFYGEQYVNFYYKQFKLGFCLPLDPFICEFLEKTQSVPAMIGANSVRYLTSFIVLCRCIGFEPCLWVFNKFFITTYTSKTGLFAIKSNFNQPKIIDSMSTKASGWDNHIVQVEIHQGWEFPPLSATPCHPDDADIW